MRGQVRAFWITGSIIAASTLSLHHVVASPRLISLAFNSQMQAPQQFGADVFRDKLLALDSKRFVVDERGSGALGSENAVLAATQTGAVDLTVISGGVVSSVVPELGVFDIPFLFRDVAHAKAVAQGPVGAAIAAKFADKGLTLLALGKQGFRNITNSKHPIRSPDDLKGLKIRVIPNDIYLMTFKALGAEVVPMNAEFGHAGAFWRFHAASTHGLEAAIFRDCDSLLTARDAQAVSEWLASGRTAHRIADSPDHFNWPLTAGMWGIRGGVIEDIEQLCRCWNPRHNYSDDERFLQRKVWPLVEKSVCSHMGVKGPWTDAKPLTIPHPCGFIGGRDFKP
jgi:hypothetical protein